MVHYIALFKLNPGVTNEKVEEMIRSCRTQLLRISEAHSVRSGKRIDPENEWPFFLSIEFENLDKMKIFQDDPIRIKFEQEVLKPNTRDRQEYLFELEPGKDVKYS